MDKKENISKLSASVPIQKLNKDDKDIKIPAKSSKNLIGYKKGLEEIDEKALDNAFSKAYPDYGKCVCSQKMQGLMKSYAYNSYKGIVKNYNEDRVIVVSQIQKPQKTIHRTWPKMSYFAVFDGHGGESCSEYLKNNFLDYLIENKNFPHDIKTSITETFDKLEDEFYEKNKQKPKDQIDNSGSCALVAIMTENKNLKEFERITKNGGKVYIDEDVKEDENGKLDESKLNFITEKNDFNKYKCQSEVIFRHFPSHLAVVRSIGDIKVKKPEYGALKGNIIHTPEVFVYDYSPSYDFMVMGCDGIFDDLSNEEIIGAAWHVFKDKAKEKNYDLNLLTEDSCDMIIKYAMDVMTSDNLSCIVIGMEGVQKFISLKKLKEKK